MYKYVAFDFDNTLSDFDKSEAAAARLCFQTDLQPGGVENPALLDRCVESFIATNAKLWAARHTLGVEAVFQKTIESVYAQLRPRLTPPADSGRRYLNRFAQTVCLEPGSESVLTSLAPHASLFIISNGLASIQARRIAASPIAHHFQDVIVSGDVGVAKPSPQIFDRLIATHRIPPTSLFTSAIPSATTTKAHATAASRSASTTANASTRLPTP